MTCLKRLNGFHVSNINLGLQGYPDITDRVPVYLIAWTLLSGFQVPAIAWKNRARVLVAVQVVTLFLRVLPERRPVVRSDPGQADARVGNAENPVQPGAMCRSISAMRPRMEAFNAVARAVT